MNDFIFNAIFFIVPIFVVAVFVIVIAMLISPKLRGKMMSRQIKAAKYMLDESKNDLENMATSVGNIGINVNKNILDKNEATLKGMSTTKANISKEAIEITARAIKDGIIKDEFYCKYCGKSIDKDSKFCKYCGKEQ